MFERGNKLSKLREAVYLLERLILCSRTTRGIKGSGISPGCFLRAQRLQ